MSTQKSVSPAMQLVAVSPSDGADLVNGVTRGIYVGETGNLNIHDADGDAIILNNLVAGIVHPIQVKRVLSTSTTCTGIVAVY
jgi:hypothetical protein